MFASKKGMSPLIATVLLIAFAVAMGAMIMNWSAGIEAEEGPSLEDACKGVSITTQIGACYSDNSISFSVLNDGTEKVSGVQLSSIADGNSIDIKVSGTEMIPDENIDRSIPYIYAGGQVELEFVPLVVFDEEIVECRKGGFAQSQLPNCS